MTDVQVDEDALGYGVSVRSERQRDVLHDVAMERCRQDSKWGDQSNHNDKLWATIHGEEYGEVCRAILEGNMRGEAGLYDELIQLAATCVAHAEALRVRGVR